MEQIDLLLQGFEIAITWQNLLIITVSCIIGTMIGMLPGIGPINAIAIIFPITFSLGLPVPSIMILFAGIYYGSQYGNSISSILVNVPGTSSAAATAIDGHQLTKKGMAGKALSISAIASFFGGTLPIVGLIVFSPILSELAIQFGPAEYFVLMIFAFTAISSLSAGDAPFKGLAMALVGIAIGTIGADYQSGMERFTFEQAHLIDGISFIVVVIGIYGVGEVFDLITKSLSKENIETFIGKIMITSKELIMTLPGILRSAVSGFFIGVLPGAGATIAAFIAYNTEKRFASRSKIPDEFGKGDLRGVAAPEAANNASAVGAFIPLLILGVPGSETTAVMLGSLLSFGVTPGPLFLSTSPDVFWGFTASMFLGNIILLILNLPLVGLFAKVLLIPRYILVPIILSLSFIGVYSITGSYFDIVLTILFGVIGFVLRRMKFPMAPLILGLILGGLIETNLRRALAYSQGDFSIFFSSAITNFFWLITIASLVLPLILKRRKKGLTTN